MKAGLYARVSSEEQAEGYSISAQLEAMRDFCESQGWAIAREYIEPGFTARTDDRPIFGRVLQDAERGAFDVLVTHKLDRAFRSLLDQLQRLAQLDERGITYVSVVERIDYSTPHGKLFMSYLGALNQYYSDNLSEETRKGKRARAKSGLSNAGIPPRGYDRVEGQAVFQVNETEAKAVLRGFELYASGGFTYVDVAGQLNREGHPAEKQSIAGRWTPRAVAIMLGNRFYIGEVQHNGAWYPGRHQAIIPLDLFDRVQEVKRQRATKRKRAPVKHDYLLKSLVFCWHCRSLLYCETVDGRYQYYRDSALRRGVVCAVVDRSVRVEVIDGQVGAIVERLRLPEDWQARIIEVANHRQEQDQVERERGRLQERLGRLRFLYLEGDFDEAEYRRRKADLQGQLSALREPEQAAIVKAGEYLDTLGGLWGRATLTQKRQLLQGMLKRVYVDLETGRVICIEPWPEFAALFREIEGVQEDESGCFHCEENHAQD